MKSVLAGMEEAMVVEVMTSAVVCSVGVVSVGNVVGVWTEVSSSEVNEVMDAIRVRCQYPLPYLASRRRRFRYIPVVLDMLTVMRCYRYPIR